MPLVLTAFALLLLVIAAGMLLLAKTNKEALGVFFRFVSWFLIVSGFLGIALVFLMAIFHAFMHHGMMKREHMMMNVGMNGGWNEEMMDGGDKRIIIKKFGGEGECPMMHGNCEGGHCEKEGECDRNCKEKNVEVKKDTVIIKTK
ncbi:MAG TPA: hypothetical protein VI112_13365 [Bacteroidia bacterium]|jgi:hypothetical protein